MDSAAVTADDDTRPHTFETADPYGDAAEDDHGVGRSASDHSNGWSDTERRESVHMDPAAANPYGGGPAYGSIAPPGVNPYAGGMHHGATATAAPPAPAAHAAASSRPGVARRARLKIAHLGPISVFRVSLTFSLCMFIVLLVAVAALWAVLDTSGVFKSIEDAANTLTDKNRSSVADWLGFGRVMLITAVIGAANVIAVTLLSTIGALLYNLCSDFVGGVEVTLVER